MLEEMSVGKEPCDFSDDPSDFEDEMKKKKQKQNPFSSDDDSELSSVISPKFRGDGLEVLFPLPKFLGSGWASTLSNLGVMETVV